MSGKIIYAYSFIGIFFFNSMYLLGNAEYIFQTCLKEKKLLRNRIIAFAGFTSELCTFYICAIFP